MTDEPAACYGILPVNGSTHCPRRDKCQLFAELGIAGAIAWAHCFDGETFAKFVPIKPETP